MLAAGALGRAGYLSALAASDPAFSRPMLDGAYNVAWAEAIVAGTGWPGGAFYLAPLPAYVFAGLRALAGRSELPIAILGAVLTLAAAWCAAAIARRLAGAEAGWCAAALLLANSNAAAHQPASAPASRRAIAAAHHAAAKVSTAPRIAMGSSERPASARNPAKTYAGKGAK